MTKLFEQIRKLNVLVVGDIMLDAYVHGDVFRISPEAPVPVITHQKDKYVLGGAANVARNISSLNAKVSLCCAAKEDEAGLRLKGLLRADKISCDDVFFKSHANSIIKTRIIVRNQQFCRLDREDFPQNYALSPEMSEAVLKKAGLADLIIVSDYAKGVITEGLLAELISIAKGRGILISVDPKPQRHLNFKGVGLITPNRAESYELAGLKDLYGQVFPSDEICKRIYQKYGPENLVITLGADGMLLSREGKAGKLMKTMAREVFDVSGAGDTVISAVSLALAAGSDLEEAAHFGNAAAGVVVGKFGTSVATEDEILKYLSSER